MSSLLASHIIIEANSVFHVEWDNLNKITSIHGSNFIQRTGGIMIKELNQDMMPVFRCRNLVGKIKI